MPPLRSTKKERESRNEMTVGACVAAYDEHNEKTVFKHEHGVKALAHGAAGSQGTYGAAASRGKGSGSCSSARPPSRKGNHSSSSAHIDPYCITAPQRRSTLSCLPACHLFSVAPKRGSPPCLIHIDAFSAHRDPYCDTAPKRQCNPV